MISDRSTWMRLSFSGATVGVLFVALSLTPSLLPRPAVNQGLISGLAFAVGYLLAVIVGGVVRRLASRGPSGVPRRAGGRWWVALAAAVLVGVFPLGRLWWLWQNAQRDGVGQAHLTAGDATIAAAVMVATAAGLVLMGKAILAGFHRMSRRLSPRLSGPRATTVAAGVVVATIVGLGGVATLTVGIVTERVADDGNASYQEGISEPSGEYRSVGPSSALSWQNAGREGRYVLSGGPSASQISAVTGRPALTPIRVYVGVDEPGDWAAHAAAAVSELDRLAAQDRDVLILAATTGTGWLDASALDAAEYLHSGSTAIVAMQYSATESWHSFVFHPGAYRSATSALISAVGEWWRALPPGDRPRLYLYGLSLGAMAVQDSFAEADDLRAFGDGVLVAGTPYGTRLNAALTRSRDAGSPVTVPILDDGRQYRWFDDGTALVGASGSWERPRVAFLQHGTDPIVWAGLASAWACPEWMLPGQRSPHLPSAMIWIPFVTGIQLMFDTAVDLAAPDGAGHRYSVDTVDAWIAVTGDGGLDAETLDVIRRQVAEREGLPYGGDV